MPVRRWRSFLHRGTKIAGDNKRFEKIAIGEKEVRENRRTRSKIRHKDIQHTGKQRCQQPKHGALEIISSNLCSQNHTSVRVKCGSVNTDSSWSSPRCKWIYQHQRHPHKIILNDKNRSNRQKLYCQKMENWPYEHENVHINKVKVSGLVMNDNMSIARFASSASQNLKKLSSQWRQ